MPIAMVTLPDAEESVVSEELTDSISDWRENLYRSWRKIADDFVTVRRREDSIKPLMSAQQQWLTRETLKHYLLQAQSALLSADQKLFSEFLALANESVQLFEIDHYQVQSFGQALEELQQTNISRKYPQQLSSQLAVEDTLKARTNGIVPSEQRELL